MSALPPKADMCSALADVCYGPIADIGAFSLNVRSEADRENKEKTERSHFVGNIAMASTSYKAPGRASCGTPTVVLAGGETVFTYLSRTSRYSVMLVPISTI